MRQRRAFAAAQLQQEHRLGNRILALACGHFREAQALIGEDLSRITVVDQDPHSLAVVRRAFPNLEAAIGDNVVKFLGISLKSGQKWDYIYTLGLTDYFNEKSMREFHRRLIGVLNPGGRAILANFVPHHLSAGWMDAVMDWRLIYRTEDELMRYPDQLGLRGHTWMDATNSIAFCEMRAGT